VANRGAGAAAAKVLRVGFVGMQPAISEQNHYARACASWGITWNLKV
jgi:hypothetical protein